MKKHQKKRRLPDLRDYSHCVIPGCEDEHHARGLCITHYKRHQRAMEAPRRRTSEEAADKPITTERVMIRVRLEKRLALEKKARAKGFKSLAVWFGAFIEGRASFP